MNNGVRKLPRGNVTLEARALPSRASITCVKRTSSLQH
jgi:hypothetical protein